MTGNAGRRKAREFNAFYTQWALHHATTCTDPFQLDAIQCHSIHPAVLVAHVLVCWSPVSQEAGPKRCGLFGMLERCMKTSRIRICCSFYEGDDTLTTPTGAKKTQSAENILLFSLLICGVTAD